MKNSRTSTNKNVNKKSSTVPSSTTSKNVKKKNIQNNTKSNRNDIKSKKVINSKSKNSSMQKNSTNLRNSEINIRLNKSPNLESKFIQNEYDIYEIENVRAERTTTKKKIEKESKKNSKIKASTILKIFVFIGLCIVLVYLMFNLDTLNLSNIKIEGNDKYSDENIIKSLNLEIGQNVFKQLFNNKDNNVNLAYISELKYSYEFPSTIVVTVKERYPQYMAQDKNTKKYYKIDNEGYLLEECEFLQRQDEIIIDGFVFEENPEIGQKINDTYINKLEIYKTIKKQLQNSEIPGNITKVNFSNSLTIITLDDKLNVVFANDSNLAYKVSFLKSIIIKNNGMLEGTIDMSVDNPIYSKYD